MENQSLNDAPGNAGVPYHPHGFTALDGVKRADEI